MDTPFENHDAVGPSRSAVLTLYHGRGAIFSRRVMMAQDTQLRVGDVAGAAGVHVQTLHYYERRGPLTEPGY